MIFDRILLLWPIKVGEMLFKGQLANWKFGQLLLDRKGGSGVKNNSYWMNSAGDKNTRSIFFSNVLVKSRGRSNKLIVIHITTKLVKLQWIQHDGNPSPQMYDYSLGFYT